MQSIFILVALVASSACALPDEGTICAAHVATMLRDMIQKAVKDMETDVQKGTLAADDARYFLTLANNLNIRLQMLEHAMHDNDANGAAMQGARIRGNWIKQNLNVASFVRRIRADRSLSQEQKDTVATHADALRDLLRKNVDAIDKCVIIFLDGLTPSQ